MKKIIFTIYLLLSFIIISFGQSIQVSQICADNNTVSVDVDITAFNNVSGITIKISYDNTIINNPTISNQMIGMSGGIELNDPNTPNLITLGWLGKSSLFSPTSFEYDFANGTLYTITFDVIGNVSDVSNLTITFEEILTGTTTLTPIPNVTTNDGSVSISANCSLPVELTFFKIKKIEDDILLHWQTASEKNNEGFYLERSADSKDWETIDFVQGNGTTQEVNNYSYFDKTPLLGDNYYRLRQVDLDDHFEYSDIVSITSETTNQELQIYPNPVKNELNIIAGQGQATIYNLLGQPVTQLQITNERSMINVHDLQKGQYILYVQKEDGTMTTKRFVK